MFLTLVCFFCTSAFAGCAITGKGQVKNGFQRQEKVKEFYFELGKNAFMKVKIKLI